MEIPKLRLVLLAFLLLSVFSCFVITACTSEQPKRPVSSVTPTATATAKVTPTPEPTATPSPTETPSPTYTSTPSNPNRDSTECESIVPSLCARSRTDQPAPDQNLTDVIVGRWQSRYNTNSPGSGNYQIITTVEFYSDGTYKFGAYDTSKDPLRVQSSGQWKRTDKNIIFANTKNSDSGKVYEHKYRIIDQDTIINSYGQTFIRLP